jgi:hypothetical protein
LVCMAMIIRILVHCFDRGLNTLRPGLHNLSLLLGVV